jgi:hypothetical protein
LVVIVVLALPVSSRMALAASGAKGHVRKGGLASVALEATPSPALGGRLLVALPRTAEDIPRAESIMAAEASPENEDRFVADFGKLRVVVLVRDTFALAPATPGEFAMAALQQARADGLDTGAPAAIEPLDLPAPLRAVKLVPSRLHCREGGCLAGAAFVAGADRLCEVVAIFVSPNAAKDAAGARALADAILGSVRSGGRAADLQGHKRQLGVLFHDEKLFAEVPASSMLSADTGPDFSVYRVWLLEPLGVPRSSIGIYVGSAASFQAGKRKPFRVSTVLGREAAWYADTAQDGLTLEETLVKLAEPGMLHVFLTGSSERLPGLRAIADSLSADPVPR